MRKILFLFALCCLSCICSMAEEQNLTIVYLDGSTKAEALANVARIEIVNTSYKIISKADYKTVLFEGDVFELHRISFVKDNIVDPVAVSDIKRQISVTAYPNPTSDVLHIDGKPDNALVTLFSINGSMVLSTKETEINMSGMQPGVYMLQCGTDIIKIIKK